MANRILAGAVAGAAGVVALNAVGYLDMLIRGRPASDMPARLAAKLADEVGLPLEFDADEDIDDTDDDDDEDVPEDAADNRREALGALLGMANGIGIGIAYGICRLILPQPPAWLAGAALGAAAMAASDYPATRLGLTEPRDWSAVDWASDVLPHMAFGVVTAVAFEAARD
jgi:hypothetical protein